MFQAERFGRVVRAVYGAHFIPHVLAVHAQAPKQAQVTRDAVRILYEPTKKTFEVPFLNRAHTSHAILALKQDALHKVGFFRVAEKPHFRGFNVLHVDASIGFGYANGLGHLPQALLKFYFLG